MRIKGMPNESIFIIFNELLNLLKNTFIIMGDMLIKRIITIRPIKNCRNISFLIFICLLFINFGNMIIPIIAGTSIASSRTLEAITYRDTLLS